jgi:hypothetical protein
MSFDNNDDEEDNQNEIDYEKLENARYMKMARSRSRKQSKLFSQRKKVNLPKIENSKQLFNEIYRNKRLHGPIYILTETSKKHQKPKGFSSNSNFTTLNFDKESPKKSYDYNVFGNEDEKIKDLVTKFRNELKERKIGKLEKRKLALNKLYNITPEYELKMKEARRFKSLDLEKYQNNILSSVPYNCIEKNKILDLVDTFRTLKNECESVKPFPNINIKIIKDHILKKSKVNKSDKCMRLKDFLNKNNEPKDEFEKEQKIIKEMKCFKVLNKFKRNKNYDILPFHIREALVKNLKLHL